MTKRSCKQFQGGGTISWRWKLKMSTCFNLIPFPFPSQISIFIPNIFELFICYTELKLKIIFQIYTS